MNDGLIYAGSCYCPVTYSIPECLAHAKAKCAVVVEGMLDADRTPLEIRISRLVPSLNPLEYVVWFEVYVVPD